MKVFVISVEQKPETDLRILPMVLDPVCHYASNTVESWYCKCCSQHCADVPQEQSFPSGIKMVRHQVIWALLLVRRLRFSEGRVEVKPQPRGLCNNLPASTGLCSESTRIVGLCVHVFCSSFCTVGYHCIFWQQGSHGSVTGCALLVFPLGLHGMADVCLLPFALYKALAFHSVAESLGIISAALQPSPRGKFLRDWNCILITSCLKGGRNMLFAYSAF